MTEYNIERFDAVMEFSDIASPMIYIKPDPELLEFAKKNNNLIACEINGTGNIYDGKIIPGVFLLNSSSIISRSNFFRETGLCTVSLLSEWHGYPEYGSKGTVKFSGSK